MNRSVFLLVLFAFLAKPAVAGDDWPQFRGPTGDGHSDSTGLPVTWSETEHVRWKTPIHGRGWSSPVVLGDQIWITTATEDGKQMSAVCLDRESGKIVHDLLLFENEKPKFCHALNSYASCTPAIDPGRVYVHFGAYGTACLDTTTGKTIWERRDLECDHWRGPGSSPILFENLLIVHYDGYDLQYVVAFNKETGKTVWKIDRKVDYGTTDGDIMKAYCTPIVIDVAGKKQLVSPTSKAALAYDPRTGEELWRVRFGSFSATARPLFGHGLVFINTGFGKADLLAVRPDGMGDVTDSHVEWKVTKSIGSKPSPLLIDGLIYNVHDAGVATCNEATTGKEVWTHRLGGNFSASPIYGDGKIYFLSQEGKTHVVKPGREFTQLAENTLADGFMASPAVTGKSLILRTRSALYRIEN
jgi:outer membrane protein assembly factor BamB